MHAIPMQSDKPRDEQFEPLLALVLARRRLRSVTRLDEIHECVVQQHRVAGWAIDYAVQNVCDDLSLWKN
jgi:hypothetical protein